MTLGGESRAVKERRAEVLAICEVFFSHRIRLRKQLHALQRRRQARKGSHSRRATNSPSRERFRPPSRPTFRLRVRLLGRLRPTGAPCSAQRDSCKEGRADQGRCRMNSRNLRGRSWKRRSGTLGLSNSSDPFRVPPCCIELAPSSSAEASAAAPFSTGSRASAGRTSFSSSGPSSPAARPSTRPGWSGSSEVRSR